MIQWTSNSWWDAIAKTAVLVDLFNSVLITLIGLLDWLIPPFVHFGHHQCSHAGSNGSDYFYLCIFIHYIRIYTLYIYVYIKAAQSYQQLPNVANCCPKLPTKWFCLLNLYFYLPLCILKKLTVVTKINSGLQPPLIFDLTTPWGDSVFPFSSGNKIYFDKEHTAGHNGLNLEFVIVQT